MVEAVKDGRGNFERGKVRLLGDRVVDPGYHKALEDLGRDDAVSRRTKPEGTDFENRERTPCALHAPSGYKERPQLMRRGKLQGFGVGHDFRFTAPVHRSNCWVRDAAPPEVGHQGPDSGETAWIQALQVRDAPDVGHEVLGQILGRGRSDRCSHEGQRRQGPREGMTVEREATHLGVDLGRIEELAELSCRQADRERFAHPLLPFDQCDLLSQRRGVTVTDESVDRAEGGADDCSLGYLIRCLISITTAAEYKILY